MYHHIEDEEGRIVKSIPIKGSRRDAVMSKPFIGRGKAVRGLLQETVDTRSLPTKIVSGTYLPGMGS